MTGAQQTTDDECCTDAGQRAAAMRDALSICLPILDAIANEGISLGRDEEDGRDYDPALALGAMATRLGFDGDPAPMLREFCPDYSRDPTNAR